LHRIRVNDLRDPAAFRSFLSEARVHVEDGEGPVILARCPGARSESHERNELAGYVATWNALNPSRPVVLE
jgi:hypothetical protein